MPRRPNTDRNGNSWTEDTKIRVWNKGTIIPDFSADVWRRDRCLHAMRYSDHGNRNSEFGWEIDHINPVANGGSDDLSNLQPLYWEHNTNKGDSLNWKCP
ncbi:MAG: HNH endonuclease [Bacteroidales bacterium]|nr:HNH endonuclease [Bacteroidales bacterium]